jgi:hypothetical protein
VLGTLKQTPLCLESYSMVDVWDAYVGNRLNEKINSRSLWETARLISYVTLKSQGQKTMKRPQDLMKFEWEEQSGKKRNKIKSIHKSRN